MPLPTISEERALAHWKALTSLPLKFVLRFHNRFLDEQPHLASFIADCIIPTHQPGMEATNLVTANSALKEQVAEVTDFAARIAEVTRREAGRPLRQISQDEVERHFQPILDTIGKLPKLAKFGELADILPLVIGSRQEVLLRGVCVAYFGSEARRLIDTLMITALLRLAVDALDAAACQAESSVPSEALWSLDRVEEALSVQGDPMRRTALMAAESLRKDLAPRLIGELESWIADPKASLEEDGSLGMHGLFLLARWREPSAWPVLRRLFSLPGETAHDLCGDLIAERGGALLASVIGDRDQELREMFEDESVEEFCRGAALEALVCRVAWGEWPRAEIVGYLRALLSGQLKAEPESYAWTSVVSLACDLEAWELRPEMDAVLARGLVDEHVVDAGYVTQAQAGEFGPLWTEFIAQHSPIGDAADETPWLDEFDEDGDTASENPADGSTAPRPLLAMSEAPKLHDAAPRGTVIAPPKIGRNEPCPCGSGKKYKKCCGR